MSEDRLTVLLYKNSFRWGGAEKQTVLLANYLSQQQLNVIVAACHIDETLVQRLSENVEFVHLPEHGYLRSIANLDKVFKRYSIDVCHSWDFKSSIIGFLTTRLRRAKFVDGSIRSAPSKEIFKKRFPLSVQRKKVKLFSLLSIPILSNSYAGLRSYGIQNYSKAVVIYNGFVFSNKNKEQKMLNLPGEIKICMVANMRWKKDFMTLIKGGLAVLKEIHGVNFYLIGDGIDKEKYIQFLEGNAYQQFFHFPGFVENVLDYVREMDICVLCNEGSGEGLSNSIMEYMGCGKPVIATDMGGNAELVADGKTGFLIREKDSNGLAERIRQLIQQPERRREMGAEGKARLFDLCAIENVVRRMEEYYKGIVK